MKYDLTEKVAVITGASSGIGLALAHEFAKRGTHVALAARNVEALNKIKAELEFKYNIKVIAVATDVSIEEDCKNLIERTIAELGQIDILINNAGISMRASFLNSKIDVLKRLMDVNFWGTVYCTKYALPHLIKTKGSIVGVSSIAGFHGLPARTGYSASKFAMHGFLETIRIENLHNGVHVLIVAPGFTSSNIRKTALTADGSEQGETPRDEDKMMTPEYVASRIYLGILLRKRNIILSVTGKITVLMQRVVPRTLDKLFYNAMKKEPNSPLV